MISVRIISLDYYMSYPIHSLDVEYSEFRGVEVKQVPVIQIFGAFQEGHKTCLNVHGVFPYIYIPYDGSEPAGNMSYKIATELDKALNTSLGQSSSNTVHVHSIVLASSRPFYGYHKNNHQFFKICFYNPAIVKKACGLLENGAILGKNFQPHESHINYILQFMIDYNLHGMSFINISEAFYRNSPDYPGLLDDIPPNLILSNEIQRRSTCKFELDAFAANILNKNELEGGKSVINPGIAALWADEKQRRRDKGKDSQISFNLTQERNEMPPTESHIFFANKLTEKLMQQSDETSLDLDSSVYPAETPENVDFSNASSVLNETINFEPSETNEDDEKLFKILLDLKESAEVEEDSLLSQQVAPQEAESVEEDLNLSLPLEKIVLSGDSIWENSFWDNCDEIPQIDGLYDTDTSENDSLVSSKHLEIDKEYRIASEVYVNFSDDMPESKKLKPGMNKLIAIRRKSPVSKNNGIKIISDVSIKGAKDTEKDKIYNNYPINDVIINDVTLYSTSPDSEDSIFEFTLDTLFETQSNLNTPPGSPQLYDNFEELFFDEFKLPETEKSPEKPSGIKMPKFKIVSKDETAKKLKEPSKNCLRVSKGGTKKTRTRNRNKCSCIKVPEKMLNMLLNVKINPTLSQKFASKCSLSPERDKRNKECNYIQVIEDEQNSEETPINNEINYSENVSSKEDDQYAFLDRISTIIPQQILENDPDSIDNNAIENTQQEEAKPVENKYQIDKLPIDFNLLIENWTLDIEEEEDNKSQKITGENNNNEIELSQNYSEEITKSEMQIKWKHYWEFQEISKNLLDNTTNKEISTIIDKMSTLLSTNKEISSEHKETSINDESTSKLEFTNASANEETSKTLSIHEELSAKFASADKEISKSPSINEKLSSKLEPTTTNTSVPQNISSKLGLKMANVSVEEKMASKNEVISRIPSIHDEMSCKINPALDNAVINGEISSKLKQLLSKLELLTTNASIEEEITSKYEKTQSIHEEITSRINSTWVNAMINEEMSLELELSAKPNKVLVNEELSSKREICTADTSVDEKIASEHESSNGALFHEELSPKHDSVDEKILKAPSIQKENSKINLTSDKAIKNGEMSTHGKICSEINLTSDIASISGESFAELNFTSDKASVNGETSNYPAANEAVSKELSQKSIDQNLYSLFEKECIISSTDASINKELSKTSSSDENFDQINKQHWNLDGQDDTPSDSVSSVEETAPLEIQTKKQTKIIKKKKKVSCRAPGLSKKSTKNGNNYINLISPENSEDEKSESEINHKRQVGSNAAKAATRANIFKKDLQVVLTPLPSSVLKTVRQKQIHFFSASEDEDLDLETRKLMQKDKNANIYIDSSENEQLTQIEPENQPKITEKNISLSSSTEEEIAVNLKAKRLKKKPAAIKTCLRNRITGNSVRNEVLKICSSSSDEQEVISAKKPKLSKWSRRKYSRLATKKLVDCTEKVQKKEADKSVDKDQDFISRVTQSKNLPKNTRSKQIISNNKDSPKSQQTEHQNIFSKIPFVQLVRITPEQFSGSSKDYEIISSNSSTEIKDIVVEKHTSPKKMLPSKYSPLKVIRSPRKHRQLIRKEDEPLAKRLRNNIEGVTAMKNYNMNKTEKASKSANGTGELKKVPILLKDCKKASPAVENVPQICDIVVTIRSPNSINRSIKKNLFNSDDTPTKKIESKHDINLNLNYVQEIREKEEQFMKQFEENSAENINNNNTHLKSYNNQSIPVPRIVKKKDKKLVPLIRPKDSNYIYFSPIKATKNDSINLVETLSQQNENELIHIDKYNTKIRNLTAAEKYDLEKNFAPQPGCSKIIEEEEIDNGSSNYSFSYEFSLMDNTFLDKTITNGDITKIWMPKYLPPSRDDVQNTLPVYNIPENRFQEPFYSNYSDVTGKIDIGHNVLKISSNTVADLDDFESCLDFSIDKWRKVKFNDVYPSDTIVKNIKVTLAGHKKIVITPVIQPPSRKQILKWIEAENNKIETKTEVKVEKPRVLIIGSPGNSNDSFNELTLSPFTPENSKSSQITIESSQNTPTSSSSSKTIQRENLQRKALFMSQKPQEKLKLINIPDNQTINNSCQITGVTLNNTHGFETSLENLQDAKAISEPQNLTILAVELHIRTRGDFYPDPQYDSVRAIFYSISNDVPEDFELPQQETGVIVVDTLPGSPVKQREPILNGTGIKCQINYVKSELELIDEFIKLIRKWDPDIFTGFEIEMLSWGYLIERCYVVGINLPVQISRTNPAIIKNKDKIQEGELKLTGRIILDAWRLFRHEIALQSYTFENLMFHILHQRIPQHSFKNLSFWWEYRSNYYRYITANYYINKVEGILKLLDHLDLIGRTCELARLFGIQFYEVLSRGSQFRVESMMLRLAKPLNYIPVSPSVQQRANMRSPEWVPLILEPESRFYSDPVIVLDFQSLYPSIIIAYNYCFSTCIGRVEKLGTNNPFEFGACQLKILRKQLEKLQEKLNFSPCGVGFVKPEVTKGVLPQMLTEILETRLMVKSSMKQNKNNKLLQRVLHNRQLGLKLIANVTYGYTSANFSGRMPCIEVGDSVVSKGRETLERAIKLIECNEKWRAKVVYGDTDSLFVLVPGRNKEDAFKIGAEMAETITNDNPPPVKLKLEKVYQPCILQTKKRYVGYMYESADQKEAEYNAKGIETVRRDGCPAVAKMLEKSLRLLFETKDMSLVKRYVLRQFEKLLSGRASLQDLIFAREFRGISGYRPGACVPALELARRWTSIDKRREPRRGERVPYVIVHGPPGLPLIRLVKSPMEVINPEQNISLRPNAVYYITRVIAPALNRCLGLVGADVLAWFNEMPRKQLHILPTEMHFDRSKKSTISQYFATMSCVVCNNQTRDGLCEECCHNPQQSVVILHEKLQQWERSYNEVTEICQSCCGRLEYTDCVSLDCPVLYRLHQIKKDLKQVPFVRNLLSKFS